MYSLHKIGEDGKTPYERLNGRRFRRPLVPFGQKVLHEVRPRRVPREGMHQGKMETRYEEGVFLGVQLPSGLVPVPQWTSLFKEVVNSSSLLASGIGWKNGRLREGFIGTLD